MLVYTPEKRFGYKYWQKFLTSECHFIAMTIAIWKWKLISAWDSDHEDPVLHKPLGNIRWRGTRDSRIYRYGSSIPCSGGRFVRSGGLNWSAITACWLLQQGPNWKHCYTQLYFCPATNFDVISGEQLSNQGGHQAHSLKLTFMCSMCLVWTSFIVS